MEKNDNLFRMIRIILYCALVLGSVLVIVLEYWYFSPFFFLFLIFLVTGIVGLFIEVYKK